MNKMAALCLIMSAGYFLQAQTIDISGSVTNEHGDAIPGAVVTLDSKNMSDTTDMLGEYTLYRDVTSVKNGNLFYGSKNITLKKNALTISCQKPEKIKLEFFDMRGCMVSERIEKSVSAGKYCIDLNNKLFTTTLIIVRVTIDQNDFRLRYLPLNGVSNTIGYQVASIPQNNKHLAKQQAIVDSLHVSALGYQTETVSISSYEATVDIVLEPIAMNCTESKKVNLNVSGTGSHQVVVETNDDQGINEGTIYRPQDLGPDKNYPVFVWGEGACALNGTDNSASMAQIASHGYVVIADGRPSGSGSRPMEMSQGAALLAYIDWIIAENRKPCSIYYQSIDTTKIASNGFSCGGMLAMGTAHDPRITTWGLTSSGSFNDNHSLWNSVHTPVLIVEGEQDGTGAYNNGKRDYYGITALGHPVMFFSNRHMDHGGDLWDTNGGDFTRINLAWLNWWLKGDEGPTGKGVLVGDDCSYCTDHNWEVMSENLP